MDIHILRDQQARVCVAQAVDGQIYLPVYTSNMFILPFKVYHYERLKIAFKMSIFLLNGRSPIFMAFMNVLNSIV
jgi:hypothetical protein